MFSNDSHSGSVDCLLCIQKWQVSHPFHAHMIMSNEWLFKVVIDLPYKCFVLLV